MAGLCLVVTILAYSVSLTGGYVYEDQPTVQRPWAGWLAAVGTVVAAPARSVTYGSYALTASWGGAAWQARTLSLLWHLANGLLLWVVARRAVGAWAATIAVGVFWLSPIQVEAVAYVGARSELVAATWLLLALWCVQRRWWVLAWLAAAGAVTGKEAAVSALALVPVFVWWTDLPWGRRGRWLWAGAGVVPLVGIWVWGFAPTALDPAWTMAQLTAVWRLAALVVWPAGLTLEHDWAALSPLVAVAGAMAWAVALTGAWAVPRLRPLWWAGVWTLAALSPRLSVVLYEGLHERHFYTPMIGISLAIGIVVAERTQHMEHYPKLVYLRGGGYVRVETAEAERRVRAEDVQPAPPDNPAPVRDTDAAPRRRRSPRAAVDA